MKESDAFGQALWDQFHGLANPAIIERDDGLVEADIYGMDLYFRPYAKWPKLEKRLLRYARGRVLDIGCGAGRHSLYLQEKGHRVTAIDNSPLAAALCRERGIKQARVLAFENVARLAPAIFDTVVLLGHNLGLLRSETMARTLLKKLEKVTKPGARILGTTVDPYSTTVPDHLTYQLRNRRRGRMAGQLRVRLRYGKMSTPWFDYLFLSKAELERILEGTNWKLVAHIPSGGPPYGVVLERL